jgi:hypothetical protein
LTRAVVAVESIISVAATVAATIIVVVIASSTIIAVVITPLVSTVPVAASVGS